MSTEYSDYDNQLAEEFLEKFSIKAKVEELMKRGDVENLPLVLTGNLALFATATTILVANRDEVLSAEKIVLLVSAIISCLTVGLNVWFLIRVKIRETKFKDEREVIFQQTKLLLTKTLSLIRGVTKNGVKLQIEAFSNVLPPSEELLKKIQEIAEKDSEFDLAKETQFIFAAINELSFYKILYQHDKCLDSPLQEDWPSLKLFIDRLSNKLKYTGFGINLILMLCIILIVSIV